MQVEVGQALLASSYFAERPTFVVRGVRCLSSIGFLSGLIVESAPAPALDVSARVGVPADAEQRPTAAFSAR